MALIGEIRNRAGFLVLVFVGVALLAFLLMDISGSSRGAISGGQSLGEINGKEISLNEYERRVNDALENYRSQTQGAAVDNNTDNLIRENAWNSYLAEMVASDEYEKLGLVVTTDELTEKMTGSNPHPSVASSFVNPQTGQFDPSQVVDYVNSLDDDDTRGLSEDKRRGWDRFTDFIRKDAADSKYRTMIKKGAFIPSFMVNNDFASNNAKVSLDFIQLPFAEVLDSEVAVTDGELQTYLNNNKGDFDDEATRSMDYVEFFLSPSERDSLDASGYVSDRMQEFRTAANDTQFLSLYSEQPLGGTYLSESQLVGTNADKIFNARVGQVVGPYFENGFYKAAKLIDRKNIPDSVDSRHILIDPNQVGGAAIANARADSILNVLQNGGDFDFLAADFSHDSSNAENGGNLGYAKPGQMVTQFNDLIFYKAQPGQFYKVATNFGFHIVEVLRKSGGTPSVSVGFLTKQIEAGGKTQKIIYRTANEFAGKNRTGDAFDTAVKEQDYIDKTASGIKINDTGIPGIENSREIVKWMYDSDLGTVSEVFAMDDRYIVAKLSNVKKEGELTVEGLRDKLTAAVQKDKRVATLIDKVNNTGGKNLKQKANKLGLDIQTASDVNLRSGFLEGVGAEPAVIGRAFALNQGDMSEPIEGNNGVYLVKVAEKTEAGAPTAPDLTRQTMSTSLSSSIDANVMNALRESVEVEDKRYRFY